MTELRQKRQLLGLSTTQAAKLVGYSQSHFSLIERGYIQASHDPTLALMDKILREHKVLPLIERFTAAQRHLEATAFTGCPLRMSQARRRLRDARRTLDERLTQLAAFLQLEKRADGIRICSPGRHT
jgi:transcriptional regulator with XRE-family HTH domain